jgi:hypothetical protein
MEQTTSGFKQTFFFFKRKEKNCITLKHGKVGAWEGCCTSAAAASFALFIMALYILFSA